MTDRLFSTATPATLQRAGLQPALYGSAKIVGCFHPRILSRAVGNQGPGVRVKAVFHRRAADGQWSVDILMDEGEEHLLLLQRSPWMPDRAAADRWLRYRSRKA